MADSVSSHFANIAASHSQKIHITDDNSTPILSTTPDSSSLTSLAQALLSSNSAVEHLGIGRIRNVHAEYTNGQVVQSARLDGKTGVVATIAGKEATRNPEVEKVLGVLYKALQGEEQTGEELGLDEDGERVQEEQRKGNGHSEDD